MTNLREAAVREALTLFESDTVLGALGLMQRHGISWLPVVDDVRGELKGFLGEEQLFQLWERAPLARLGDVLEALAADQRGPRPRRPGEPPLELCALPADGTVLH